MGSLGDNDEEEADKQNAAREPKIKRGAALGSRDKKDAKPLLIPILHQSELMMYGKDVMERTSPGLRSM
jgi:hypothetical protein